MVTGAGGLLSHLLCTLGRAGVPLLPSASHPGIEKQREDAEGKGVTPQAPFKQQGDPLGSLDLSKSLSVLKDSLPDTFP